ncbi:MAG: tetratricopeptide repeat protein, partial [Kordiimonadaceae bacterium]|nr:tetratricopeptide repeat protein [Kordiimonadaceae bacterium]
MSLNRIVAVLVCLGLSACSSDENSEEAYVDYTAFDNAAVRALFDAGDFEKLNKVIRIQEQKLVADKDDFLIHADMFLLQYEGIAAEVALDKAKGLGAEDAELTLRYVRAFMMQRDFRKALDAIGSTVLTGDASYEALLLRGDIHRELNDVDLAREFFTAAIEDRPEHFKGYLGLALLELNLGNLKVAEDLSSRAALYVTDDPIVSYVRGTAARYLLRPDDAIVHLEKAIELHPAHILANLELAGIYIDKNMHEKAQEYLDFVYGISPEDPMARYYSALILATEGKMKEAEEVLLRIGDLTRQFPPAARVYGHVAFRLGKFSNAKPYLERFLGLVPEDRLTRLALAESQTRRGQPAAALVTLEPLINGPKGDMEAYMQAAAAAGFMGEMLNALDYIAKAKDLAEHFDDASPELLESLGTRLALTRFMTGDLEKAAEQLRAMYGDASNDFTSLTLLANLQMDGGDLAGAKKTLVEISKVAPDQA